MTKHTPATPLPLHVQIEQPNDGFAGDKQKVRLYSGADHVATVTRGDDLPRAKQRAAYLAHAANAYPKLVEALRVVTEQAHQMTAMLYSQDYYEQGPPDYLSQVDALLRSLGEND